MKLDKGPDHLESTILKITGKISVVIHSSIFGLLSLQIIDYFPT